MKLLYNIPATFNSAGMERVLANKVNWLVDQGYEVSVVTTDQKGLPAYFPMNDRIRFFDLGINYDENNGKSFLNKLIHFPFKQIRHKRRLKRLIDREKPDIVISMFGNEASLISGMDIKARKVLEVHFSKMKKLQYGRNGLWHLADLIRTKLDGRTIKKYDRFVTLTEEDMEDWGSDAGNISVIPNALTVFPNSVSHLDRRTVISIGRLSHQKGFDRLISVWSRIASKMPGWKLEIIGGGDQGYTLWLNQLIDEAGVRDSVTIRPPMKNMSEVYENASILAMTSRYEGLPMVLLESQAYGIPAVSFACKCGPRDVITDGENGFLVEDGNLDLFAEKMLALMQDEDLRRTMGASARNKSKKFSEERVMSQWDSLFKGLVTEE
ncbi:MAG: glycosyltransferase family 4 protein [Bacteroidales bacterium]|nr:glycosyltransferase family 4 protein [Bacteroidales bacterium]